VSVNTDGMITNVYSLAVPARREVGRESVYVKIYRTLFYIYKRTLSFPRAGCHCQMTRGKDLRYKWTVRNKHDSFFLPSDLSTPAIRACQHIYLRSFPGLSGSLPRPSLDKPYPSHAGLLRRTSLIIAIGLNFPNPRRTKVESHQDPGSMSQ
jgi:hypothetical protein